MTAPTSKVISVVYNQPAEALTLALVAPFIGRHEIKECPPPRVAAPHDAFEILADYVKKHFGMTIPPRNFDAAFHGITTGKPVEFTWMELREFAEPRPSLPLRDPQARGPEPEV